MQADASACAALTRQKQRKSGSSRWKTTSATTGCLHGAITPKKWAQSCVNLYLNASKAMREGVQTKLLSLNIKMSFDSHFQSSVCNNLGAVNVLNSRRNFPVELLWHLQRSCFNVIKTHQISSDGKTSARWWFSFLQGSESFLFLLFFWHVSTLSLKGQR